MIFLSTVCLRFISESSCAVEKCSQETLVRPKVMQRDLAGLRRNSFAYTIDILQKNVDVLSDN